MQAKLFPKTQYGLKTLPEPPTLTKAQQGELFNRVKTISSGSGKIRAELWSRFQNHCHKDLPADQFEDAMAYLDAKQAEYTNGVEMLWLTRTELDALITERIKALPAPDHNLDLINILTSRVKELERKVVEGEVMPRLGSDQIITTKAALKKALRKTVGDTITIKLGRRDDI